ncbi:MAG: RtcB family protein [bacterium]
MELKDLKKIHDNLYEIPRQGEMRVPGRIYANAGLLKDILSDKSPEQVMNVATLPGILKYSLAMPDMHWGYGFPIGGVAATDMETGVISPGGVGYDINCGCRLVRTSLSYGDIKNRIHDMVTSLFQNIPCGVGSHGAIPKLTRTEEEMVMVHGSAWAVKNGFGTQDDLDHTEESGCMSGANPDKVSDRARERGLNQLGTLGSGNHFIEIQVVEQIFDDTVAQAFGLFENGITFMIHSGSRGFGYQICDDYLKIMSHTASKYHFNLPDRQLACAPLSSPEGKDYMAAMACAANFAWANRQIMMHLSIGTLQKALGIGPREIGARLVYDVCHNIAKFEEHQINGGKQKVCVHRKGATRAFPPGHPLVPKDYRHVGQPVLIPGDMGRASYVSVGTETAMQQTFGSSCHGAGRLLSRHGAIKAARGRAIYRELEDQGIIVMSRGKKTLSEEMPEAYKDIHNVVQVMHDAGIAMKVARMRPIGVIKG